MKTMEPLEERIARIVAGEADPNATVGGDWDITPLFVAADAKQTRALLEAGADPNVKDGPGVTPLWWAHDTAQMQVLLDAGADPNVRDKRGRTLLHHVCSPGNHGLPEQVSVLIHAGADPNARADHGWTPLHCVRSVPLAKALLANGANPTVEDEWGCRPSRGKSLPLWWLLKRAERRFAARAAASLYEAP